MLWWLITGLVTAEIAIVMLDALVTELGWVPIGAARRFFNITREDGVANGIMIRVADVFSTFPDRAVHFSKSIEEFLEMAGTTIFLFVFLKTLMHTTPSMTFEFNNQG